MGGGGQDGGGSGGQDGGGQDGGGSGGQDGGGSGGQDGGGSGGNGSSPAREIPEEIDDHYRLFGKEPWEIDYGEMCPLCDTRADEYGLCACDSGGE